jgi:hypothetical protein
MGEFWQLQSFWHYPDPSVGAHVLCYAFLKFENLCPRPEKLFAGCFDVGLHFLMFK